MLGVSSIVQSAADAAPLLQLVAYPTNFSSSILQLIARRPAASTFNYISAAEGNNPPFFALRGDGQLLTRGVTADGGTSAIMSEAYAQSMPAQPALTARWASPNVAPTNAVLRVLSDIPVDGSSGINPATYSCVVRGSLAALLGHMSQHTCGSLFEACSIFQVAAKRDSSVNSGYAELMSIRGDGELSFTRGGMLFQDNYASPTVSVRIPTCA